MPKLSNGGLHGGVVVSTIASQREGSRFNLHLGPFCVEFACSVWVLSGYFLPLSKSMHVRLIGVSKFVLRRSVCVCLFESVWTAVPHLSLDDHWDSPPETDRLSGYRKWMDSLL